MSNQVLCLPGNVTLRTPSTSGGGPEARCNAWYTNLRISRLRPQHVEPQYSAGDGKWSGEQEDGDKKDTRCRWRGRLDTGSHYDSIELTFPSRSWCGKCSSYRQCQHLRQTHPRARRGPSSHSSQSFFRASNGTLRDSREVMCLLRLRLRGAIWRKPMIALSGSCGRSLVLALPQASCALRLADRR